MLIIGAFSTLGRAQNMRLSLCPCFCFVLLSFYLLKKFQLPLLPRSNFYFKDLTDNLLDTSIVSRYYIDTVSAYSQNRERLKTCDLNCT